MKEIVILSAVRTPVGAFQGALAGLTAPQLGARALAAACERSGVEPAEIEQVYMGNVLTAGVGQAPARQAALAAGCPVSTGAVTVGKVCGSAMRAVMTAANDLRCGDFGLVAAGGMESMSQAPYLAPGVRDGLRLGHGQLVDSMVHDGLWDPYKDFHMGNCAEICAEKYAFTREEQDAFALESYTRARQASEDGASASEIVAVEVPQRKGDPVKVERDEEPFRVELDRMGKTAFCLQEGWYGHGSECQQDQRRSCSSGFDDRRSGSRTRGATIGPPGGPGIGGAAAGMVHHGTGQGGR